QAWSRDGKMAVTVGEEPAGVPAVFVWNTEMGKRARVCPVNAGYHRSQSVSPDGKYAAVILGEQIRLLDTRTGRQVWFLQSPGNGLSNVDWSPLGDRIAVYAGNGGVSVREVRTSERVDSPALE